MGRLPCYEILQHASFPLFEVFFFFRHVIVVSKRSCSDIKLRLVGWTGSNVGHAGADEFAAKYNKDTVFAFDANRGVYCALQQH